VYPEIERVKKPQTLLNLRHSTILTSLNFGYYVGLLKIKESQPDDKWQYYNIKNTTGLTQLELFFNKNGKDFVA